MCRELKHHPSAAPETVSVCIPSALSVPDSVFVFLSLEEARWGKGNIYECDSLFAILFLCLCSFFLKSAQFLHSAAASRTREQAGPICLRVHGGKEGQTLVDKRPFKIL